MIEVEEYDHLNHSPGYMLAVRGQLEIEKIGFGPREVVLHYLQKTIVARLKGRVVGVIVWERVEASREAWITLGYVDPDCRGRGVYNALYRRLVEVARRESLRSVAGGVSATNATMRAVAERQGRVARAVTYAEEIVPAL